MMHSENISVVMATYNGDKYVAEQISSILGQLEPGDELIVVDDGSSDDTVSIILSFMSSNLRLIRNQSNLGAIASFEKVLGFAKNEYVFLSDQDDVWKADKREAYLAAFRADPEISLVISDLELIDSEGTRISSSFMDRRGGFKGDLLSTIWRNRYIGCAIAIRRSLLEIGLPFPRGLPMHDMWLGIVALAKGRICYLPTPYISYRRHDNNVSGVKHSSIPMMVSYRLKLLYSLLVLSGRLAFGCCRSAQRPK